MGNYFCGWYFRCQSDRQTLAVIPSHHRTAAENFCIIQLITDTDTFNVHFPGSAYRKSGSQISIEENRFGPKGVTLNIHTKDLRVRGALRFGAFTPLRYDIMGPFCLVPFMQCRHSVYSLHHSVDGTLSLNGTDYSFQNAVGYMEGDRGNAFPKEYLWTQCSFSNGSLMLSIADIPLGALHFTGIIGVVYLKGKEYRLATYLGAKAAKITQNEIIVQQGKYALLIHPKEKAGHPLLAPENGIMNRTIHEHPSCPVHYRFESHGIALLDLDTPNAALEYEY